MLHRPRSGKPDSKFGGVQIGAITYSWRSMPGGLENVVKYCKEAGVSSIELMSGDLEDYLGAPKNPMAGTSGPPAAANAPAGAPPAGAPPATGSTLQPVHPVPAGACRLLGRRFSASAANTRTGSCKGKIRSGS